jgi:biofilm PGA synthesis N-glycosyltransferase PgaC
MPADKATLKCSVGIMAYNEAANIERLLYAILRQPWGLADLLEILVVASGCTDETESIVQQVARMDRCIRLIIQPERKGKASAINLFLSEARGDILILESGDTVPGNGAFGFLLAPFNDHTIGMTGGRPVPVNSKQSLIGFAVHLLWELHHRIALVEPKLGELVAFRGVFREIPADTAVDEASLEALVRGAGLSLQYVPEAIVYNKGPETVRDFIRQRRRIAAGHKYLARQKHYRVSTFSPIRILAVLLKSPFWRTPKGFLYTLGAIMLEAISRSLGAIDTLRKKNPFIWEIAATTKQLEENVKSSQ